MNEIMACDLGGTNSKITLYSQSNLKEYSRILKTHNIEDFKKLLEQVKKSSKLNPQVAIISAAGPIEDQKVRLRNASKIKINAKQLVKDKLFKEAYLLNDFEAIAYSLEYQNNLITSGSSSSNSNILIIGAGTGLGVCYLTNVGNKRYKINPSEIGHSEISRTVGIDLKFMDFISKSKKKIIFDDICSGRGVERAYKFLTNKNLSAKEISELSKKDFKAREAMHLFFDNYAIIIKHIAKYFNCQKIYITGGIIQKNLQYANDSFLEAIGKDKQISIIKKNITRDSLVRYYLKYKKFDNIIQI